jgi:hypothetical protein
MSLDTGRGEGEGEGESIDITTVSKGMSATLYIFRAAMVRKGPPFFAAGVDIYKNIPIFILVSASSKCEQIGSY